MKNNHRQLRIRQKMERNHRIKQTIYHNAKDIVNSYNFKTTRRHTQHGTKSVHSHCYDVAKQSLWFNRKFKLNCQEKDLIRGALLHDYFLYDWHEKNHGKSHGFYHPGIALENAGKEYQLSPREKDIIKKHMWPMTLIPPLCREAWVVTAADKYCSLLETLHISRGNKSVKAAKPTNKVKSVG